MKKGVLILLDALEPGGGENIAVNIAIRLKDSPSYTPFVCATRAGGELEKKLKASQVPYLILQRNYLYQIHKFTSLRKTLAEQKIQIIHAHKTGSNFWGSILGRISQVKAVVAHVHGKTYSWKNIKIEKLVGQLADKVISVSEFEKRRLVKAGVASAKIVTIHNGINPTNFKTEPNVATKSQLAIRAEAPIVGICAGLRPEKNHEVFLYAAREVANKRDAYFLIVGDGERRRELEALAVNLGIAERCIFAGFVKEKIADMLSLFDIGVLCSELEAMPLTLLEYMASAKPIVATNVGGIPEVIQDGVNGFLVPPRDPHALAQKLLLLLTQRDIAKKMGDNGFCIVKQKFSEEVMVKKIEELYTQTLATVLGQSQRRLSA